ncbi:hypothetical protein BLNAU_4319 [Blattamonas nauphoetae]|uniref:HTH CENPB-type domain-containing protein n=1 Tax=Blattamonas nauphoetae TaxID=2049346 RepID=A0ABQ9YAL4_9EUKA|nr:hypothetical protein BLNAU_4319 [Blattamonas nauphoetae]
MTDSYQLEEIHLALKQQGYRRPSSPNPTEYLNKQNEIQAVSSIKPPVSENASIWTVKRARRAVMEGRPVGQIGRPPILYDSEKTRLVDEILELNDVGVYPTYYEIGMMAKTISEERESLAHRDVEPPSRCWVSTFVKEEPRLKASKPTVMALARIKAQTKSHVRPFFQMLQSLDDPEMYPPSLRVNFDETSLLASQAVISFRVGPSTKRETFVKPINQIFSCTVVFFYLCRWPQSEDASQGNPLQLS